MKDGIIKGTGNSRYLKGAGWPATYTEFKAMAEAGTLPFDLNGINAAGWQQIGTPLNKGTLLSDNTAAVLELGGVPTVNDALMMLALPVGKYAVRITVLTPSGRPMKGLTVSGITMRSGAPAVTDANGQAFGYTSNQTQIISTSSLKTYLDFASTSISKSIALAEHVVNSDVLQFARVGIHQKTFATSQVVYFSDDVSEYDASGIGGGGKGGDGTEWQYSVQDNYGLNCKGGGGAGSGYTVNKANIRLVGDGINILVGASNGGSTLINTLTGSNILRADGGGFGETSYATAIGDTKQSLGGSGQAIGGKGGTGSWTYKGDSRTIIQATKGGNQTLQFLYPQTHVGGAGGGGGQNANVCCAGGAEGGTYGGGRGGFYSRSLLDIAQDGQLPGAGGGGGTGCDKTQYSQGGNGAAGLAGLVWRYKEDANMVNNTNVGGGVLTLDFLLALLGCEGVAVYV